MRRAFVSLLFAASLLPAQKTAGELREGFSGPPADFSTPRNLFGPFHNPAKLRMRAWPAAWREFPEHQPSGKDYDLLDYGLMAPVSTSIGMP